MYIPSTRNAFMFTDKISIFVINYLIEIQLNGKFLHSTLFSTLVYTDQSMLFFPSIVDVPNKKEVFFIPRLRDVSQLNGFELG